MKNEMKKTVSCKLDQKIEKDGLRLVMTSVIMIILCRSRSLSQRSLDKSILYIA